MIAGSTAPRALAIALLIAGAACGRDFDGLFPSASEEGSSGGGGSSGSSGSSGLPGSSGSSGTNKTEPAEVPDECTCKPCTGSSCKFDCPAGCASCKCEPVFCPKGVSCFIGCGAGTVCEVSCPPSTTCAVACSESAACGCTGDGCQLTCTNADKPTSCGQRTTCGACK